MKKIVLIPVLFLILTLLSYPILAQIEQYRGNSINRYENHHSGNKVNSIFYNYGLIGNVGEVSCEWPIGTGNEYVGDVTPMVGIEFTHPVGQVMHSVITCSSPRQSPEYSPYDGTFWGFEPLPDFAAPPVPGEVGQVAMSNLPETWPSFWPDKMYTDANDALWVRDDNDPGWPGSWNGYFGKNMMNADQESYFQMDDHTDLEWRKRDQVVIDPISGDTTLVPVYFYPDASDTSRGGCGIRVAGRGLQWSHFLAEDCIFWLYEVTNIGTTHYDKVCFGMVVGTLSGGRQDSRDDLAFFDPLNDITYSYDGLPGASPGWVNVSPSVEVGYVGYAFLESPGNPYDGIDNDGDSPNASPILTSSELVSMTVNGWNINVGNDLIIINYDTYERTKVTMPATGSIVWYFHGTPRTLYAGTHVVEAETLAYNGIDDNFNGLIDERFGQEIGGKRLDHLNLKYKNYFTGAGVDDPMIDEARDDGIDNDGDWDPFTDDVGFDGVASTGDLGEGDGMPSYGEPNFDKTDVDESDQIGLTAFDYFTPPSAVLMNNDEGLWTRMLPGHLDVVDPTPCDGDFIYGSGYFPLPPGKTERFSMCLVFGEDSLDLTQNKITVQQIYDQNYNFARPPDKCTVTPVPGDGRVTLYWTDESEYSYDPANEGNENDFEGYKIYRATDPGFLETFTITDGLGRTVFNQPIAQFDLDNGNAGFFPLSVNGASFYLGEDSGISHVWTDTTVENGQRYFYAVCAYDNGNVTLGFFPSETSKYVLLDEGGNITTDINTCWVIPAAPAAGYTPPEISPVEHISGSSSGLIYVEVVDPREVEDSTYYEITFGDDSLNQSTTYNVTDVSDIANPVSLISGADLTVVNEDAAILDLFDSYFDSLYGLYPGTFSTYQFFTTVQSEVFAGQRIYIVKPRFPGLPIWESTGFSPNCYSNPDSLLDFTFTLINYPLAYLVGQPWNADYRITFHDEIVDTAVYYNWYNLISFSEQPVYFSVYNSTQEHFPIIAFDETDTTADGRIQPGDAILILEEDQGDTIPTWAVIFSKVGAEGKINNPQAGDTLNIHIYKGFSSDDVFQFNTLSAGIDASQVDLDAIKVYPNPYLGANTQEPANPYASGRGGRQITFTHLPNTCTIRIYNIRGELVETIKHSASIDNGIENWNLRSKDGLDVAYGVYIYHVDSPYGEHIGKFALIK